jgi:hypothetical protein
MDLENSLFRLVDGRTNVGSFELRDERTPCGTAVFAVRRDGPYHSFIFSISSSHIHPSSQSFETIPPHLTQSHLYKPTSFSFLSFFSSSSTQLTSSLQKEHVSSRCCVSVLFFFQKFIHVFFPLLPKTSRQLDMCCAWCALKSGIAR